MYAAKLFFPPGAYGLIPCILRYAKLHQRFNMGLTPIPCFPSHLSGPIFCSFASSMIFRFMAQGSPDSRLKYSANLWVVWRSRVRPCWMPIWIRFLQAPSPWSYVAGPLLLTSSGNGYRLVNRLSLQVSEAPGILASLEAIERTFCANSGLTCHYEPAIHFLNLIALSRAIYSSLFPGGISLTFFPLTRFLSLPDVKKVHPDAKSAASRISLSPLMMLSCLWKFHAKNSSCSIHISFFVARNKIQKPLKFVVDNLKLKRFPSCSRVEEISEKFDRIFFFLFSK